MPKIDRPKMTDVFELITLDGRVSHMCPREIEWRADKPDQWEVVFPNNIRISYVTNKWPSRDKPHPVGWIEANGHWYPAEDPERFPAVSNVHQTMDEYFEMPAVAAQIEKAPISEELAVEIFQAKRNAALASLKKMQDRIAYSQKIQAQKFAGLALDIPG